MRIILSRTHMLVMRYAAAQTYLDGHKEAFCWLLGDYPSLNTWLVEAVVPDQIIHKRTRQSVETHLASEQAQLFLDMEGKIIGTFHSHPDTVATASPTDKADLEDGECMLISSIHTSPKGFTFKFKGYVNDNHKIRTASLIII